MSPYIQSMFIYVLYACMHTQCSSDHAASSSHLNRTVCASIHKYTIYWPCIGVYSLRELIIKEQNNRRGEEGRKKEGAYYCFVCMTCCRSTDLQS